ncbi:MAG: hypothetical protein WCR20_23700, partial [Verrucomicrobiota bacterium]
MAGVPGATTSNTIAQFTGNSATYTQIAFQNLSDLGSAQFVAAADNGDDTKYHMHMGFAGSNYVNPAFTIASKNDGYVYAVGSSYTGPGTAGNLVLGSTSGVVKVFTGNTVTANLRTTTSSIGFDVLGNISATGNISASYLKTANTWINNGIVSNGNVDFSGANTSLGAVANLHITGGTGGQFMTTNGSGVVSWANVAGANVTGTVANATFAASAGAVAGANVSGQVANALVAGTIYTNAQPNITSVGSLTSLVVGNTANAANINLTGITGNGFITMKGQTVNPTAAVPGTLLIHATTVNGYTRMEQDNESTTNLVYGRDNVFLAKNSTGSPILKGSPVHAAGVYLDLPVVALAQANSGSTLPAIGIALDDIPDGTVGQIMYAGLMYFDTSAFTNGAPVWVSTTVAGGLTSTRPSGITKLVQRMGTVLIAGIDGVGLMLVQTALAVLNQETGTSAVTWTGNQVSATAFTGSGANLTNLPGANVSGAVGLATFATTANAVAGANVSGQVSNALVSGTVYT